MRLWSLHPKYLDPQGLVALWREGLLAKKVLENKTKGYKNHPQLNRFKEAENPLREINLFLHGVCDEADSRGYNFDRTKLKTFRSKSEIILVTSGQMEYEWEHLLRKQAGRSKEFYAKNIVVKKRIANPIFKIVKGNISEWEVIT